jgi:Holliday junction resolvase
VRSTRQKGNVRENDVIRRLQELGYFATASRGSRGVDIIAYPQRASDANRLLLIEVGGASKNVTQAFAKMREIELPEESVLIVARYLKGGRSLTWRYYCPNGSRHKVYSSLSDVPGVRRHNVPVH